MSPDGGKIPPPLYAHILMKELCAAENQVWPYIAKADGFLMRQNYVRSDAGFFFNPFESVQSIPFPSNFFRNCMPYTYSHI